MSRTSGVLCHVLLLMTAWPAGRGPQTARRAQTPDEFSAPVCYVYRESALHTHRVFITSILPEGIGKTILFPLLLHRVCEVKCADRYSWMRAST